MTARNGKPTPSITTIETSKVRFARKLLLATLKRCIKLCMRSGQLLGSKKQLSIINP